MYTESGPLAKRLRLDPPESSDDDDEQEEMEKNEPELACYVNLLPDEILIDIFERLFFEERLACALVCKRWRTIVRCSVFMQRTHVDLGHSFGYMAEPAAQYMLKMCTHLTFGDCGSIPGMIRGLLTPVEKAVDLPGPSSTGPIISVDDFIFSGKLQIRSLTITALFGRIIEYVRDRLPLLKNLEEFAMNILPPRRDEDTMQWYDCDEPLWTISHPNVSSLTVLLYADPMSYEVDLPKLSRLNIEIDSDNELNALRKYSKQLEELTILFYFTRGFEQTLTYPFPMLRKLRMSRYGSNDTPDPNTPVDDASAERFIDSAPLLEDVTLCYNIMCHKMLRAVCLNGARSITRLTLHDIHLPRRLFALITELKLLEFLKVKRCILDDGGPLREIDLPKLRTLMLINSGTCIRIDQGLSSVTRFRYTIDPKLPKVCQHMMQLQVFELKLRTKYPVAQYVRDHFHTLAQLCQVHTLRLSGIKTNNRPWDFARPMPAIERLVLRKCNLVRGDFHKLPKLFPSLRVLELDASRIGFKRHAPGIKPIEHFRRRLKQFFPRVNLVMNPATTAVPIATMLEMEDEYRWHLTMMRRARAVIEPICPKRKAKFEAKQREAQQRRLAKLLGPHQHEDASMEEQEGDEGEGAPQSVEEQQG